MSTAVSHFRDAVSKSGWLAQCLQCTGKVGTAGAVVILIVKETVMNLLGIQEVWQ